MFSSTPDLTAVLAPVPVNDALDGVELLLGALSGTISSDGVSGDEAKTLIEQLGRISRHATSLTVLLAGALPDDTEFALTKDHSAKKWLGRVSGTSQSAAQALLGAAENLAHTPVVEKAIRSGALSGPQLGAITDAIEADPNAEADLVAAARVESLFGLGRQADRVKAGVAGHDAERHAKAKKRRRLGMSNSRDGWGIDLNAFGPADQATIILQALRMFMPDIFKAANAAGERPTQDQMMWDALVAMAAFALGDGPRPTGGGRGTKLIINVDYEALVRRCVNPGETCELVGVGPIPVSAVIDLINQGDIFLAAVITHAKQVYGVAHFGRSPKAFQVTALEWMNPQCIVEGCDTTILDWEHTTDWNIVYETETGNIVGMCPPDHSLKTTHGWRLAEGTGRRPLHPPGHPDHPGDPHHSANCN